jgi:hypothetical protein
MLISISYSLYGKNSNYYFPLREQLEVFNNWKSKGLYKEFNFEIVVFVDKSVDLNFFRDLPLKLLYIEDFAELRNVPPKMWRYYNVFYNEADVYLFRDSDSCITDREVDFIRIWLKTDYESNVIRDTRLHLFPIMAGTFSVRKGCISMLKEILKSSGSITLKSGHFYDQIYLAEVVYPKFKSKLLVFTNFLHFKHENYIRTDYRNKNFIGGYYNDNNLSKHWHDNEFVSLYSHNILKFLLYSTKLVLFFISIVIILNKTKKFLNANK